ncbi:MAG: nucleotide sugar dehydrogenase [Azoarcus sp. PHD]|nr:MAG: nucleotide sugar dehydrogenase [Azoarcus sp. PHD]
MSTIAVIGLGYVGLPLAVEFGKKFRTLGFDLSEEKVAAYRDFVDPTGEVSSEDLRAATQLSCHTDPAVLKDADFIIVAVPTPVDEAHQPDFTPLVKSSQTVGRNLKPGAIVVYESTVYPGATEEVCIPILERESGLKWKEGFFVGYSPERINPGDKERTVTKIVKVVSGDTAETLATVSKVYGEVITAGVYPASSIKVAEAAKVIENTQRDLNIALMNELSLIFHKIGIDTLEVLKAAGTKWNFLPFRPGLVGGHCIGVDPYYLTHKADMLGYHPQVILAGRRINDGMGKFVAEQTVKEMIGAGSSIKGADVIVLGLTFKENCPDLRNSKVIDVIRELQSYGCKVHVHDAVAESDEALHEYGVSLTEWDDLPQAQAIVAAVSHSQYLQMPVERILEKLVPGGVFTDVKSAYDPDALKSAGARIWRL